MKRREFLRSAAFSSLLLNTNLVHLAQKKVFPDLALTQGDSPELITKEAIALIGGMSRFIYRGDRVIIKPNIAWDRTPAQAACTNPFVVKALVELSFEVGAKEVIVIDNPTNSARRTYVRSGIADVSKKAGAKVLFPNPHRLKKISINGEWLKEWEVFTNFIEADKIINVPIAKTHSLSRLTMGMKNWLGALGGNRSQLHQKLDQVMVDLAAFFRPSLTVLDAFRILIRNGPQGGRLSDTKFFKKVVAGVDPVAIDALGATFFDIVPQELPYLQLAHERGLGEINLQKLKIEMRMI
ncbi:MAG: DUF362 domain-containing protein [Candidatus Aminicenantaceae bacterium]